MPEFALEMSCNSNSGIELTPTLVVHSYHAMAAPEAKLIPDRLS